MKHVYTFENFLNEGNISMYKSTVVAALKQLGYNAKQSDLKIGIKKERNYDLITLNGELLCSSSDYAQMVTWIQNAVKEDPAKYGLDPKVLESAISEKKEELYIAHVDDSRKPGGSDKEIKNDYNLEVRDRDNSGFDIVGSKEDIQAFVDDYGIILADDIASIDEANDLSYWKDYAEGSNQSPNWYSKEAKTASDVVKLVKDVVNYEIENSDDKDADVDPEDEKKILDLATAYLKQFKSINGHVVSAMLFQEAK
jgi:hypothetical protein